VIAGDEAYSTNAPQYRVADKSLARPRRKQANVSVGALPCRGGGADVLGDSSGLHVVEIVSVPDMLPSLFPSRSG